MERETTAIPELEAMPLTKVEFKALIDLFKAGGDIQDKQLSGGASIRWHLEIAAAELSISMSNAETIPAVLDGEITLEDAQKMIIDLTVRRAMEIYGQGGG